MSLLDSTLGAIGQVGSALDKYTGGRAVRGALAGKPRELASIVPFSDTMGLTDERDATTGRDLTNRWGLTNAHDGGLGSHALGFLADTATSPLSLLAGGAAFKAAPTLAKGVLAGGKALTGLDLVDQLGRGARSVGRFAKGLATGESGAMNLGAFGRRTPGSGLIQGSAPLTPPLNYGPQQSALHQEVMQALGGDTHKAWEAIRQGPRYDTDPNAVINSISDYAKGQFDLPLRLRSLTPESPLVQRLSSELSGPSPVLGHGIEGMAFRAPTGHVVRANYAPSNTPVARLNEPEMLLPFRSTTEGRHTVEHLPSVTPMRSVYGDSANWDLAEAIKRMDPSNPDHLAAINELVERMSRGGADRIAFHNMLRAPGGLSSRGVSAWDTHAGNVGVTKGGKATILDPGAVELHGAGDREAISGGNRGGMGIALGQESHPGRFQWPVQQAANNDPAWREMVARESAARGVPDLIRENMTTHAILGGHDVGMAVPGWEDINHTHSLVNNLRNFNSMDDYVQAMRQSHGLGAAGLKPKPGLDGVDNYLAKAYQDFLRGGHSPPPSPIPAFQPKTGGVRGAKPPIPVQPGSWQPDRALLDQFENHVGAGVHELYPRDLDSNGILESFAEHFGQDASKYKALVGQGGVAPTAKPGLLDSVKQFMGNESGALNLDRIAEIAAKQHLAPQKRAVMLAREAGVNTNLIDDAAELPDWGRNALAWYQTPNVMTLNAAGAHEGINMADLWGNSHVMNDVLHRFGPNSQGWLASSHPDALALHELGHHLHADSIGPAKFNLRSEPMDPNDIGFLKDQLSHYSATNPKETVAEMFSALAGGRQFDTSAQPELARILKSFSGKKMWQQMGDNGMLKPLGLSLAAAMAAKAAGQGQA